MTEAPRWAGPSPFVFDGPLPAGTLVGRREETAVLRDWMRAGRFVRLEAPRRFGKTSLINQLASDLDRHHSMPVLLVDLYGILSLHDLTLRIGSAYERHAKGSVRRTVDSVLRSGIGFGLSVLGTGANVQFSRQLANDPLPILHNLLEVPSKIAGKSRAGRVVIAFDEFQEVRQVPQAEAILRSHIQHQRDVASYLFAGSAAGMSELIFADKTRPLFGQAEAKDLGRLEAGVLAEHIEARFAEAGRSAGSALDSLLVTAQGHPQRSMLLAHHLWTLTHEGAEAGPEQWVEALGAARLATDAESSAIWEGLAPNDRRVLRALARFGSAYTKNALAQLDLRRGSAQKSVQRLVARAELEAGSGGGLRFVDPLFELWVRDLGERHT